MKKKIAIIIMIIIICFQFYYIFKKNYSGYFFYPKYKIEKYYVSYNIVSTEIELLKEVIPRDKKQVIGFTMANENNKYNQPLQFYYNRLIFYPNSMAMNYKLHDAKEFEDDSYALKAANDGKITYLIIVGKDIKYLNEVTENDINLYSYNNGKLKKELSYDMDLYSFKKVSTKYKRKDLFKRLDNQISAYVENYSNAYSMDGLDYMLDYANDLYDNKKYKEAEKKYTILIDSGMIDAEMYYNYSIILKEENHKKKSLFYIKKCLKYKSCPSDAINIKNELEVK